MVVLFSFQSGQRLHELVGDRPRDTLASSTTSVKNRDKGRSREGESEEKAERERASSVALLN